MLKRLDQFDYEIFGANDRWYINKTAQMLTSFEMENKGYFERKDAEIVFKKLYAKYETYVMNIIKACTYEIHTPSNPWIESFFPKDTELIDPTTTTFPKTEFLDDIGKNNDIKIDLEKLKRYLTGEEAPAKAIPRMSIPLDQREITVQTTDNFDVHKYCFEKTTQSWNLRFMNIELEGVKDLVGMDYIAILLKSPGTPIGVIEIQAILNPEGITLPGSNKYGDVEDQAEPSSVMNGKHARSSKSKSLESLKRRLQELSEERNKLDSDHDYIELEAIDNEYAKIEAEVDNVLYAKNDDPEIKNNRDKVAKAIRSAIKNISDQKTKEGLPSTPLSNFLTQHIKTASECVYNPPTINPPDWSFW